MLIKSIVLVLFFILPTIITVIVYTQREKKRVEILIRFTESFAGGITSSLEDKTYYLSPNPVYLIMASNDREKYLKAVAECNASIKVSREALESVRRKLEER